MPAIARLPLRRHLGRLIWAAFFVAGVITFAVRRPIAAGDGIEYWATLQAWSYHGTPDIRPRDLVRVGRLLEADRLAPAQGAHDLLLIPTKSGARHVLHFWLYPLLAVPAKRVLSLVGAELAALQVTNFILFALTLYALLFTGDVDRRWRLSFAALVTVGPVLWYLPWPHPEVFIWAAVCLALFLLRQGRYGLAALAASLGAAQNAPVAALAALAVVLAAVRGGRRQVVAAGLGAAVSLVAPLFYLVRYGEPSLLTRTGASLQLISAGRVGSLLFDLNQGMLPHAPGVLMLAGVALVPLVRHRHGPALAVVATALAMVAVYGVQPNWNAGCAGMIRYGVWVLPLLAWAAAECPWPPRAAVLSIGTAVAAQLAIVLAGSSAQRHLTHSGLAAHVLEHAPALYSPEPEIFAERQLHAERPFHANLPLGFARASGEVTKLLLDACSLAWLPLRFRVDATYLDRVRRTHGQRAGLFYLVPPPGAVARRPASLPEQVSTTFFNACRPADAPYTDDRPFNARVLAQLPPGALVFEWPGSLEDPRQASLLARDPEKLVETLALAGYAGLTLDRARGGEAATALMERLAAALPDTAPLLGATGRWVHYNLGRAAAALARRQPPAILAARRQAVLHPPAVTWGPGFHRPERDPGSGLGFRWAGATATLTIENDQPTSRSVRLQGALATASGRPADLRIDGDLLHETLAVAPPRTALVRRLTVPPGRHDLRFTSDATPITHEADPRTLVFRLEGLQLHEPEQQQQELR